MRLLHTGTLELSDFNDQNTRPYCAILSHTWGDDEFVFSDFAKPDRRSSAGWEKTVKCCELAAADGWRYVWVDTCCIDKSSSAELTEAINSMWKWYRESQMCYVHLADCYSSHGNRDLRDSRWFTRGWTLQELLAPERVVFYDANWQEMGSRSYLQHEISEICNIAPFHFKDPTAASVATKMSWASSRVTTREEDLAYSLLGLFDINMSLIYGEGSKAFFRLQSEIIRSSSDHSIFAWKMRTYRPEPMETGMLAPNIECFASSDDIVPKHFQGLPRTPYQITNRGIQIELGCVEALHDPASLFPRNLEVPDEDKSLANQLLRSELWLIMLPCVRKAHDKQPVALLIQRSHEGIYTRINFDRIWTFKKEPWPENSNSRLRTTSFLIASEGIADRKQDLATPGFMGRAFVEVGSALQRRAHGAQKLHLKQVDPNSKVKNPFNRGQWVNGYYLEEQWVFQVDLEGGPQLVIIFDFSDSRCDVFAARNHQEGKRTTEKESGEGRTKKKIEKRKRKKRRKLLDSTDSLSLDSLVGAHITTLRDTDDYALPYNEEHQILLRTRRVVRRPPEVSYIIRLDLAPLPK